MASMTSTHLTEQAFRLFVGGDIEYFYTHIYRDMLLYAVSCLPGQMSMMAEDCVQNAVEKAYWRKDEFTSSGQWKAFLITCIRNKAISYQRKEAVSGKYQEFAANFNALDEDILVDYIRQETLQRLYAAIDALPEDMRVLLEMSFEEGLKNSEIAKRLGVAEITVKKRKARLISLLREQFPEYIGASAIVLLLQCLTLDHV